MKKTWGDVKVDDIIYSSSWTGSLDSHDNDKLLYLKKYRISYIRHVSRDNDDYYELKLISIPEGYEHITYINKTEIESSYYCDKSWGTWKKYFLDEKALLKDTNNWIQNYLKELHDRILRDSTFFLNIIEDYKTDYK